jgi:nitrate/TMAO reductase-like tetraheme cytochrome c subunit
VNRAACFLCHLRPDLPAERGKCTLCHEMPGVVKNGSATFDHARVGKQGVDCQRCHAGITEGSGPALRQRCLQCHNSLENLGRFTDTAFLHDRHVRQENVNCQDCHLEVRHSLEANWVSQASQCESCHPGHHRNQKLLFSGEGAHGIEKKPGPMFQVRTGCLSCHVTVKHVEGEVVLTADAQACTSCHDQGFAEILEGWKSFGEERGKEIADQLTAVRKALETFAGDAAVKGEAGRRLAQVEANALLVKLGHAAHNFSYAEAIFDAAEKELGEIARLLEPR